MSKTDFLILGSAHGLKQVKTSHIRIGNEMVPASTSVKNIGAVIDRQMKMNLQVNQMVKGAWYNLYQLSKIRKFLSEDQLKTVVHSLVISKLDYNNGLLAGCEKGLVTKLQSVQNAAAKFVCGIKRFDRVTPPLEQLHWLPVSHRIHFKLLLLCYKCLNGDGPQYLTELLEPYKPQRTLRSSSANMLVIRKTSLKTFGDRAFSVTVPRLWNELPNSVKECSSTASFKKALKTHLFRKAFKS